MPRTDELDRRRVRAFVREFVCASVNGDLRA
jgi:hypothetical protein